MAFDGKGRADPAQRLSAEDLAQLLGLEAPEPLAPPPAKGATEAERAQRFTSLLAENQSTEVAAAVTGLLEDWQARGGELWYGRGADTSCSPVVRAGEDGGGALSPVNFYPLSGNVEVGFQYLSRREPFTDIALRRSLMERVNRIPGVQPAEAKLALRPNIPMNALPGEGAQRLGEALAWFFTVARRGYDDTGAVADE